MKSINEISRISVKKGERFYYDYTVHPSVGKFKRYEISDNSVVALVLCDEKYRKTPKPGTTGGDLTDGRYTFAAVTKGSARITIVHDFRGTVEREDVIDVEVID